MKHKGSSMVIENASVVTPAGVLENASIKVADGTIAEVGTGHLNGCGERLNARGMCVLPGFIDLHSDAIEKEIEPRTSAIFPLNMAIIEMDKKVAACGITTMYHSLSYSQEPKGVRSNEVASEIVREINRLAPKLGVRTRIHARFEITSLDAIPYLERLINEDQVHLLSIMDHKAIASTRRKLNAPTLLRAEHIRRLVRRCDDMGIPVASHDDETKEKLDAVAEMGIRLTEFPMNMEVAVSAASKGMRMCFGSPNVVRGCSLFGTNLNAREAIKAGLGDILCSDYAPMSLVHAVFTLERTGLLPLHRAANMASLNPAKAVGVSDRSGSLEAGKSADMIIVDPSEEVPRILKTFVEGREVFSTW